MNWSTEAGIGTVLQAICYIAFLSYGQICHLDEKPEGETIARVKVLNHAGQDKPHVVHCTRQSGSVFSIWQIDKLAPSTFIFEEGIINMRI